jgi:general nucleoside transport system permease protein
MDNFISVSVIVLTLSISTPLFIAALGALLNERVGIVNVGLEGIMLFGAFTAAAVTYFTHSPWLGVLSAILVGAVLGLLHAVICIAMKTDHVVSGVAINILAASLTVFLLQLFFQNKGQTPSVESIGNLGDALSAIPVIGAIFKNMSYITIIGFVLIIIAHIVLNHSKVGLRLRSVGENPHAARSLGIPVKTYMYVGVIVGCALVGLAGAYLSIGMLNVFTKNMSAGRGFIALAVMIFGRWSPVGSLWASLFFGYVMALQISTQGLPIPSQVIEALPYIVTLIVLVFTYRNAKGPAHAGQILSMK